MSNSTSSIQEAGKVTAISNPLMAELMHLVPRLSHQGLARLVERAAYLYEQFPMPKGQLIRFPETRGGRHD